MTINADTRGIMAKNFKPRRKKQSQENAKGWLPKQLRFFHTCTLNSAVCFSVPPSADVLIQACSIAELLREPKL